VDDVILDPAAALERLAPLRSALAAHDWAAARRVLDAAGPAERTLLVLAAGPPDPEGFLGHVLATDPDDSGAAALLAQHLVAAAWRIRTHAPAAQVSQEQFRQFDEGLRRAEWVLVEAVARRPDDPTLWVVRLASARGLGLDGSEIRRRYDRLAAIDPQHLPGQAELLQSLCPKWGGTWPTAFAFARECAAAATPGSLNPVLVVDAHVERWLELRQSDAAAAAGYLTTDEVRTEIVDAAQRSVWHPAFVPAPGWVQALSTFALVFSEQGDQRAAADLFARLGPLASAAPWDSLSADPVALVRERRAAAFVGAPR
jgi:hypothetical protein